MLLDLSTLTVDEPVAFIALGVAVLALGARAGGEAAVRLGQPAVLGELAVGMALASVPGTLFFHHLAADPTLDVLGRLGALLLLFEVGLGSSVADLLGVGVAAARVASIGSLATFALGWGAARLLLPASPSAHAFLGAAISATSVGISARVLRDMGKSGTIEARTILGAAVLDDLLALVVLSMVGGWAASTAGSSWLLTLARTSVYMVAAVLVGRFLAPRLFALAARLRTPHARLIAALSFCLLVSWTADLAGLSTIVGAFLAGLVVDSSMDAPFVARGERPLAAELSPISALLVPLFFCLLGLRTNLAELGRPSTLALAVALTAAALVGKLAAGLGAAKGTRRWAVASGMMPRGEVSLVFATLGLTMLGSNGAPLIDRGAHAALVVVVAVTTLVTPAALEWSFGRAPKT